MSTDTTSTSSVFDLKQLKVINAGLPWTNPLKLQVGSNEHIIDTTINRGLMMLLNNDYYLDLKASIIGEKLSAMIKSNEDFRKDIGSAIAEYTKVPPIKYINQNVTVNEKNVYVIGGER